MTGVGPPHPSSTLPFPATVRNTESVLVTHVVGAHGMVWYLATIDVYYLTVDMTAEVVTG